VHLDWGARLSTAGSAASLARRGAGLVGSAPQAPRVDHTDGDGGMPQAVSVEGDALEGAEVGGHLLAERVVAQVGLHMGASVQFRPMPALTRMDEYFVHQ